MNSLLRSVTRLEFNRNRFEVELVITYASYRVSYINNIYMVR